MIYLIGSGNMAIAYTKVLKFLNVEFLVIGRSQKSVIEFEKVTGVTAFVGGIDLYLNSNTFKIGSKVIITTGTESLMGVLKIVLSTQTDMVLIEKPGAISIDELLENQFYLKPFEEKIFLAYNRRFYKSVFEVQKLIDLDGGLQTIHFEFTEWAHVIDKINAAPGAKENLFFGNSTHVIDLAFFLSGNPVDWNSFAKSGNIPWHDRSNFVGSGITSKNVLFSYMSNWESSGRWSIELLTKNRRIYLSPLEKIRIQNKGSLIQENHEFDDSLDVSFKPGIYLQLEAFLNNDFTRFSSISDQILSARNIYKNMLLTKFISDSKLL
jgi:predicted dehydrogenase